MNLDSIDIWERLKDTSVNTEILSGIQVDNFVYAIKLIIFFITIAYIYFYIVKYAAAQAPKAINGAKSGIKTKIVIIVTTLVLFRILGIVKGVSEVAVGI